MKDFRLISDKINTLSQTNRLGDLLAATIGDRKGNSRLPRITNF